jgi:ribosomal protein S18 acetylase RimI-like enzyme
MPNNLVLNREPADSADAQALIRQLDSDLRTRYPTASIHGMKPSEVADGKGVFIVARLDGAPVGCGALRALSPGIGEIKRMYVAPSARRRGVARRVLAELEQAAEEFGFTTLRLETGHAQPEAIRLYESAGYGRIAKYGEYENDPHSVCMEKRLA